MTITYAAIIKFLKLKLHMISEKKNTTNTSLFLNKVSDVQPLLLVH